MGQTTHQILSSPKGVTDSLYSAIKTQLGIEKAAPVIEQLVHSPDLGDQPLQILGVDPFAEMPFRGYLVPKKENRLWARLLVVPQAVLIPESMVGGKPGQICPELFISETECQIRLNIAGKQTTVTIIGYWTVQKDQSPETTLKYMDNLWITDISTAQEILERTGYIDRIDLILPENCKNTESENPVLDSSCPEIEAIENLLPQNTYLEPAQDNKFIVDQMTAAFRLNLSALSLLALIVGMFLIYNTMNFSIIRRRSSLGILRCLGVTRQELFLHILGEALLIATAGTAAGLLLGIVLAQGSVELVSRTINDLYFVTNVRGVQIPFISLVKGATIGIFATLLAAVPPAFEAARTPPVTALHRSFLESKARAIINLASIIGISLVIVGGIILTSMEKSLIWSFAGTLGVILGFAMITPFLTRYLMQSLANLLRLIVGITGRMAPLNVNSSLSRTGVVVAALSVAIAVTIGLNLMIDSFRYTVQIWLEETLQGDIYITVPSPIAALPSSPIDENVLVELEKIPEIKRIDALRSVEIKSESGQIHVAASSNPDLARERLYLKANGDPETISQRLADGDVLVSEPLANRLGISDLGVSIPLLTSKGWRNFKVVGIYYDYSSSQGTLMMTLETYRTFWSDDTINAIALRTKDETDLPQIVNRLKKNLMSIQTLDIKPSQQLRTEALAVFDRTFTIAIALRGLAFLVAFIGLFASSLAWQLDKSREIGVLRAVGMTKNQIWKLIMAETGLIGLSAGLTSIPAGYLLAIILTDIINRRSFGWTLQMQIDPMIFLQAVLIAILAALLSGFYPAIRMSNTQPVDILRSE